MKKKIFLSAVLLSTGIITACGAGTNDVNDPEGVRYSPVRYDRQDTNPFNNDYNGDRRIDTIRDNTNIDILPEGDRGIFNDGRLDRNHDFYDRDDRTNNRINENGLRR